MIYTDRSRFEVGQRCEKEREWGYHYVPEIEGIPLDGPRGLVPEGDGLDFAFGKAIHGFIEGGGAKSLEYLTELDSSKYPLTPDGVSVLNELYAMYTGMTHVYANYTAPQIEREYDWVGREVEMNIQLADDVTWMTRLDGIIRRKSDGMYYVLETKTSTMPKQLMIESKTNFQLLMEVEAMRQHYKLEPHQCGGAMLLVFDKSSKQRASKKEQENGKDGYRRLGPFTYWWTKDFASGITKYDLEYKSGWNRVGTWAIPGWLGMLEETWPEVLKAQVGFWPAVSFDAKRCKEVIEKVVYTERRYVRDGVFVENYKQCENSGGYKRACPYRALCFSPTAAHAPLDNGYERREPNHPQESQN